MKRAMSVLISIVVAIVTASLVTTMVFAVTRISESGNLSYVSGPSGYPSTKTSSSCLGGSCLYLNQSSDPAVWRWPYLSAGIWNWYAYCPSIGQAAAKYGVMYESWSTVMNQANPSNWGTDVYLGYSDKNSSEALFTSNTCISGWGCYSLPVYWDSMGYTGH